MAIQPSEARCSMSPRQKIFQKRSNLRDMVLVNDRRWYCAIPHLNDLLYRIMQLMPIPATICLDNDQTIRRLNDEYRGKNRPTNVLSFERFDGTAGGDIILALQTVRREALANRKPIRHHFAHLVIHGLLHLQGYDHITINEARQMEMKEARLMHMLGFPNPWKINFIRSI